MFEISKAVRFKEMGINEIGGLSNDTKKAQNLMALGCKDKIWKYLTATGCPPLNLKCQIPLRGIFKAEER